MIGRVKQWFLKMVKIGFSQTSFTKELEASQIYTW